MKLLTESQHFASIPLKAKVFVTMIAGLGMVHLVSGVMHWRSANLTMYAAYLAAAVLCCMLPSNHASRLGSYSLPTLFITLGIVELSSTETLLLGCSPALVQCLWNARVRSQPLHIAISVGSLATAIGAADFCYRSLAPVTDNLGLRLLLASGAFFVSNTFPVAIAIGLSEGRRIAAVWRESFFWSFPYYLVSAAMAGVLNLSKATMGWETAFVILPVVYLVIRTYHGHLERTVAERKHGEDLVNSHLRTIESLALVIEAHDTETRDHLRRVQIYAVELGKDFGLSVAELEALRVAALLHDIGKLAVPQHIIGKPGKLTAEEFEKIKIHPIIGAEILEQAGFPYAVAPIVRAHHEKWDGSGYPAGLIGEQIPLGARILAAVDCLDAVASERPYHRALPLDEAMAQVAAEAGRSYDPRVIEALRRRYRELEQLAKADIVISSKLTSRSAVIKRGSPATGLDPPKEVNSRQSPVDFLLPIAAARREGQLLLELTQELGVSLDITETMTLAAVRIRHLIPFDALALYLVKDGFLVPEFVTGEQAYAFTSLKVPVGSGLVGWVAQECKPLVNANPAAEVGFAATASFTSALACPLEGSAGLVAVLALYARAESAFSGDQLRILGLIGRKLGLVVENLRKHRVTEQNTTQDELTGILNARAFLRALEGEVARCQRHEHRLAVLVCDLNGFRFVNQGRDRTRGDKVLQMVARGIVQDCRTYDIIGRLGGDQFALVIQSLDTEAVGARIIRLTEIVAGATRQVCGSFQLSVSVGEAFYPQDGNDAKQLLAVADVRMYQAKEAARLSISQGEDARAELVHQPSSALAAQPEPVRREI